MLKGAGVAFTQEAGDVDEAALKRAFDSQGAAIEDIALALAEAKARVVAARHAGALVVGADQMLECEGYRYDKPRDVAEAARQLAALSGRTHRLVSAACVVRDGASLWQVVEEARLTMRPLSHAFIAAYLDAAGAEALASVGAYRLEGVGAQLFERIAGDWFAILGLPLLPLLAFLRREGVVG